MDLICITERFSYCKKIGFIGFMLIIRKMNLIGFLNSMRVPVTGLNHPTEFCKTICLNLIQVKSLDRLVAGLNHFAELY